MGKILFVDDEENCSDFLSEIQIHYGYKVHVVKTGQEAISALNTELPDLILLGSRLSDIKPYELCSIIKSNAKTSFIPILVLCELSEKESLLHLLEFGGVDFIIKPLFLQEVLSRIETHRYVNERKNIETLLTHERLLLRTLIDYLPDVIYVKDKNLRKILANKADIENIGKPESEIIGKTDEELYPEEIASQFIKDDKIVIEKGESILEREERLINEAGKELWLLTSKIPLKDEAGNVIGLVGIGHDITARKRMEEKLIENEEKFRTIFQDSSSAMAIIERDTTISMVNNEYCRLGQFDEKDIIGKSWTEQIHVDDLERLKEYNRKRLIDPNSAPNSYEFRFYRKDGEVRDALMSVSVLPTSGKLICSIVDITERKKMELELKREKEKAELSDKLKSEFLEQISHEIRTPINVINGNLDYLMDLLKGSMDDEIKDCFDAISISSERIIRTMDLILNYSEIKTVGYQPQFEFIDVCAEILKPLIVEYKKTADLKGLFINYNCKSDERIINADRYSVKQIFANLIDNSIKYTKKGGVNLTLDKNNYGKLFVEISDTGIGMEPEFLSKAYEPFIQEEHGPSRSFDGTGLGLTLVKKYCEINNCSIEVKSEKNIGSVFKVTFNREVSK